MQQAGACTEANGAGEWVGGFGQLDPMCIAVVNHDDGDPQRNTHTEQPEDDAGLGNTGFDIQPRHAGNTTRSAAGSAHRKQDWQRLQSLAAKESASDASSHHGGDMISTEDRVKKARRKVMGNTADMRSGCEEGCQDCKSQCGES